MYHLAEYHADWGSNDLTLPRIPGQLLVNSFITSKEESLIDETLTDDWRDEYQIMDTNRIKEMRGLEASDSGVSGSWGPGLGVSRVDS